MTEEQFINSLAWKDFNILLQPKNVYLLILICRDQTHAEMLMHYIRSTPFDIGVSIDPNTQKYTFTMVVLNSDYVLEYKTGMTKQDYPPLNWLSSGLVNYITTGIKMPDGHIAWNLDPHPLTK